MVTYILNSAFCLTVFMLFYHFVLAEQKMNNLKRFYLLGSLLLAALIPIISITHPADISNTHLIYGVSNTIQEIEVSDQSERSRDVLPTVLWAFYFVGSLIFGVRLGINLYKLRNKIQCGEKIKNLNHTLVLLEEKEIPHTFLNYIFVSKEVYLNKLIPTEILIHEEAHVHQRHTLDILFVELLRIVFWFNPLLCWVKKEMKLNHEYLADQVVLERAIDPASYQQLLISFPGKYTKNSVVSPFHFLLTKKRIIMMSREFSSRKTLLRVFILVPVLMICSLLFSNRSGAQSFLGEDVRSINDSIPDKIIALRVQGESIVVNGKSTHIDDFVSAVNETTSNWDSDDFSLHCLDIQIDEDVPDRFIARINQEIKKTDLAEKSNISSPYIPDSSSNPLNLEEFIIDKSVILLEGETITTEEAMELINTRKEELDIFVSLNGDKPAVVNLSFRQ